ncbi:MAG TPA: IS21 family transposase [Nitrospirota bacterium]|nr:IS21 family transposase [Nitrospirota bacterium]
MAFRRLSMRKVKEILRLCWGSGMSARQAARSCGVGRATIKEYLDRAERAGLVWPLPDDLDDARLEHLLFPSSIPLSVEQRNMPPFDYLYHELKRKHVTLKLLWDEYRSHSPDGYQYSQFCVRYRAWLKTIDIALRQTYKAGERLFVDFAGDTIPIHDGNGATVPAYLFVATLGASNYTYAEAVLAEDLPSWIHAHVHAFEFMGCVPEILVPDNPKVGITHPCRYEPDLNPTYQDMATHYGTVVIPARVKKPKDKAKVESAVLIAERWIIAGLRNHTFFSIEELNQAIREKLEDFNTRPLQKLKVSRKHLFETLDRPAMKPLPEQRYEYAVWEKPKANIDYHVELDHHYYSVPYQLRGQRMDARMTATTVEIFFKGNRVASHKRSYVRGHHSTVTAHMPESHKRYLEWTPSRIIRWAAKTGPSTEALVKEIMERKAHPEQGFRSALGIIRLGRRYGIERLEAACARALVMRAFSYRSVQSILQHNLDGKELPVLVPGTTIDHENIRGNTYYKENLC